MIIQGTLDEANNFIMPAKPTVYLDTGEGGGGGSDTVKIDPSQNTIQVDGTVPVSGPITNTEITAITGTADQTALTTDPAAANQTMLALLRGILAEMQAQTSLLEEIRDNTATP